METSKGCTKASAEPGRKKYQCGWCKFMAVFSSTILRHHERKHPGLELDIVVLKHPGRPLTSPPKDGDYTVSTGGRVYCHSTFWRDDLDLGRTSQMGACAGETFTRRNVFDKSQRLNLSDKLHIEKHKIQTAYTKCYDILKCGAGYIHKLTNQFSLSKICLDAIPEKSFVEFTTNFKHQVKFIDPKQPGSEPKDIEKLSNSDIVDLIRGND